MSKVRPKERKLCPSPVGCGRKKVLTEFSVHRGRRDGRCTYCSECTRRMTQAYRDRVKTIVAAHLAARQARRQRRLNEAPWQRDGNH